ncbi:MAG: hypothetical protein WAM14_13755 [Candidatus Nitrosopolaris sp.]
MTLNAQTRGMLEQIIDNVKKDIHKMAKLFLNPNSKAQLHIEKENDFVLGLAVGIIQQTFIMSFFSMYGRLSNEDENSEVGDIVFRRLAEVRDEIFKAG